MLEEIKNELLTRISCLKLVVDINNGNIVVIVIKKNGKIWYHYMAYSKFIDYNFEDYINEVCSRLSIDEVKYGNSNY